MTINSDTAAIDSLVIIYEHIIYIYIFNLDAINCQFGQSAFGNSCESKSNKYSVWLHPSKGQKMCL